MATFGTNTQVNDFDAVEQLPQNPTTKQLLYSYLHKRFQANGKGRQFHSNDREGPHDFYGYIVDALLTIRKFKKVREKHAQVLPCLNLDVLKKRLSSDDVYELTVKLHNLLFDDEIGPGKCLWPTIVLIMDVLVTAVDMVCERHGSCGYQLLVNYFVSYIEEEVIMDKDVTLKTWVDRQGGWVAAIEVSALLTKKNAGPSPGKSACAATRNIEQETARKPPNGIGEKPTNYLSTESMLYSYLNRRFQRYKSFCVMPRHICPKNGDRSSKSTGKVVDALISMRGFYGIEDVDRSPLESVSWKCLEKDLTEDAVFDYTVQLHHFLFGCDEIITWQIVLQILDILETVIDGLYDKYGRSGYEILVRLFADWVDEEQVINSGETIKSWVDSQGGWKIAIKIVKELERARDGKITTISTPCLPAIKVNEGKRAKTSKPTAREPSIGFGSETVQEDPSFPSTKIILYCYLYHRFSTDSSYSKEFVTKIPTTGDEPYPAYARLMEALSYMQSYYAENGLKNNLPKVNDAVEVVFYLQRQLCNKEKITWKKIIQVLECLVAVAAATARVRGEKELKELVNLFESWLTQTRITDRISSVAAWIEMQGGWNYAIEEAEILKQTQKSRFISQMKPARNKDCSKRVDDKFSAYQRTDKCKKCDRRKPVSLCRTLQCTCGLYMCMFPECTMVDCSEQFMEHHVIRSHPAIWRIRNVLEECICGYPKKKSTEDSTFETFYQCPNHHCRVYSCSDDKCDFETCSQEKVELHVNNTHIGQSGAALSCVNCGKGEKPRGGSSIYEKCACDVYWCLIFSCPKEYDELSALHRHQYNAHGV